MKNKIEFFFKNNKFRKLKKKLKKKNGRNFRGIITIRHRGGGHKRHYNLIDNKYFIFNIPFIILKIVLNSNNNKKMGLVYYCNNVLSYITITEKNNIGDILLVGNKIVLNYGNFISLSNLSVGFMISNIELYVGHGSQINKSGKSFSLLINKFKRREIPSKVLLKFKSSEEYLLNCKCFAQLGVNIENYRNVFKKAGQKRWLNFRPKVRGVAMNPVDHPHGGGEGKTSGGRFSVTPYGKLTKGKKTRKLFLNNNLIVKRRKKK